MSLYDDIILGVNEKGDGKGGEMSSAGSATSWSNSGIKLLQDHLLQKKRETQGKRDALGRRFTGGAGPSLGASGLGFKSKPTGDEMPPPPVLNIHGKEYLKTTGSVLGGDWDVSQEYDPLWPNDYEKIMKARKELKDKERAEEKAREMEEREKRRRERFERTVPSAPTLGTRPLVDAYSDDEDDTDTKSTVISRNTGNSGGRTGGAMIAPPPSLIEKVVLGDKESVSSIASNVGVSFVAAKIMTRMGYREGQGLGREEQGMSRALEVEKTSKRGGKIITGDPEKDVFVAPPPPTLPGAVPAQGLSPTGESITEIMKNPTKVVLLRNMVGPGEVDEDLEPEVKEECTKYGEVFKCVIFEVKGEKVCAEEAVRIFVEFKRVESAIKAVVDLNGRYFGGRTVRAGFYDFERFRRLDLIDAN